MISYNKLAHSVEYNTNGSRVELVGKSDELELIGEGRSAFAFRIQSTDKVLKIFFPTHIHVVDEEVEAYKVLSENPYFPRMYESGNNYLVIDFIEGQTMFNCLTKGIIIKDKHIDEIEKALKLAKVKGLNPSDIHLRNILITKEGNVKVIDVARFRQKHSCSQWKDLKKAYQYYKSIMFPKQLPAFILNFVSYLYKKEWLKLFL
ncbi:serine/threonine protein kinase [Bacillus sp. FJAT-45350]|uniref:serine/threonine protein kinase n=1 Tax=Bacillus sp. FJAT-45350 TaxID=2011014 RepID=UPI000BB9541A|nr:serine/threonine protein kinase [Bacillus sp. FJAT-45350]